MIKLLRAFLGYHRRRPLPSLLWVFGVALGVTMVAGIYLANRAAIDSFAGATRALSGRASHAIIGPAGRLDETYYRDLRLRFPRLKAAPRVSGELVLDGRIITLIGIDPLTAQELNPLTGANLQAEKLLDFLRRPGAVLASPALARAAATQDFTVGTVDPVQLTVIATIELPGSPAQLVAFGDISWTQKFLQGSGQLAKIELLLDENGPSEQEISDWLPSQLELVSSGNQNRIYTAMLDSFNLNLTALSLLSLFVGFYLVYNTILFSLLRRRREIGVLLSMGFSRRQVIIALLAEISLVAGLGSLIGLGLGYLLARYSLNIINQTISDLYFFLRAGLPRPGLNFILQGLAVGIGSAWAAAFFPLQEIYREPVVSLLSKRRGEDSSFRRRHRNMFLGLLVIAASLAVAYLPGPNPYYGFAAAFGICLGSSLLSPFFIHLILNFHRPRDSRWQLAIGPVQRSLSRSSPAVAALMIALAMSLAISIMIGSFRSTVAQWFANNIQGDFYLTDSDRDYDASTLDPELIRRVESLPELAASNRYRNLRYRFNDKIVRLTGVDAGILGRYSDYHFTELGNLDPWAALKQGQVMISESLGRKHQLKAGDQLSLNGPRGRRSYKITAVFRDYITEHGVILLDFSELADLLGDQRVNSLALFLKAGSVSESFRQQLAKISQAYNCQLYANRDLRRRIMEIFDRSFAITLSTRLIAIVVAFFGIISALLAIYLENEREYGILRALGCSRLEVFLIAEGHSLTLGLLAVAGAAFCGPLLAWILVKVINLKSFGWTIDFHFDWLIYPATILITLLASAAAGLYPAWRIARTRPSFQMRER